MTPSDQKLCSVCDGVSSTLRSREQHTTDHASTEIIQIHLHIHIHTHSALCSITIASSFTVTDKMLKATAATGCSNDKCNMQFTIITKTHTCGDQHHHQYHSLVQNGHLKRKVTRQGHMQDSQHIRCTSNCPKTKQM